MAQNNYLNNQINKSTKPKKVIQEYYLTAIVFQEKTVHIMREWIKYISFQVEADNKQIQQNKMSIDKTLRLTDQSGSEVVSIMDRNMRATIGSYSNEYVDYPRLLTNSHSLKNLRDQPSRISELQFQNQILRQQISILRKQVKEQQQNKAQRVVELDQEIMKLKKLIEKSYYSLKIFEKQNMAYKEQIDKIKLNEKHYEERNKYLQRKLKDICSTLQAIKDNHEKEMKLAWNRVAGLQKNLQAVVRLIEEDKRDEKVYRGQIRGSRADSSSARSLKYH